jgi:polyhydroxyalkanoate synthesis regulator phasin
MLVMIDLFKKGLALGLGIAVTSKEQVEKLVDELVKKGELSREESKDMIQQLMQRGEEEKTELKQLIREQLRQMMDALHVATKDDIIRLEQRIENLEKRYE